MGAILTLLSKVVVVSILIVVGYFLSKKGILSNQGAADVTSILVKVVTPCLIVDAFLKSKGSVELIEMAYAVGIGLLFSVISIIVGGFGFKKEPESRKVVLRFAVTFGNVGFMGMPLVQGVVGEKGVVYASFGIVIFNLITWTYGYRMMNSSAKLTARTVILNPGMIGLIVGFPLYLIAFNIPAVVSEPIGMMAALNTPLAMIIVGSYIAKLDIKDFISDKAIYVVAAKRLLLAPALFLVCMAIIRPQQDMLLSGTIQAATPVAANCVLFSIQYKKDSLLASKCLAVSTLLSIVTIPIFIVLAQLIH